MPGCLILTGAEAVMVDKRRRGPRIRVQHSICIYCVILPAGVKREGGEKEKMVDRLLHSCVLTLTCFIRERAGQSVHCEAISQAFSIPAYSNTLLTPDKRWYYCCCWLFLFLPQVFFFSSWLCQLESNTVAGWLWCAAKTIWCFYQDKMVGCKCRYHLLKRRS